MRKRMSAASSTPRASSRSSQPSNSTEKEVALPSASCRVWAGSLSSTSSNAARNLVWMYITGAASDSRTVLVTTARTCGSRSHSSISSSRTLWYCGRSKYQLATGRSSGVVPVSWLTGSISSSGSNWWPRSHSSA